MSWLSRDTSHHGGEPLSLMRVTRPDGVTRYTNADQDITYAAQVYEQSQFRVGEFAQGKEPEATVLEVVLPTQHPLAQTLIQVGDVLIGDTEIVIITAHRDEAEAAIGFAGAVTRVRVLSRDEIALDVETFDGMSQQQVPRITVSQKCQNVLGDHLCRVDLEDHKFETTITAIDLQDGRMVTIDGLLTEEDDDGTLFLGGVLFRFVEPDQWVVAGYIQFRGSGDVIMLLDPNPHLTVGLAVKLYPGDDRHITTCKARFDNVLNFTGLMPMGNPDRSIMEGTGFLGYALEEDTTAQGTTTEEAPRP